MQHEQLPTISSENQELIKAAIFGEEIAQLLPEYAAMFAAENDACFAHFIDTLPLELHDDRERAESGDKDAILTLSTLYHDFRDAFEGELGQNNPDSYAEFIESVAAGDISAASQIVHDFYKSKELADSAVIDDELDTQYI
jgi:hypothetical protein